MKKIIIGLWLPVLWWGCGSKDEMNLGTNLTVLRYNESAGLSFLDPAYASRFEDTWAIQQLFNGLVRLDKDLNVIPDLAKKWEISEDGLMYTFYLRTDVHFHDSPVFSNSTGRKVIAQDFVNSFFRLIDAETASPGKFVFNPLDINKSRTINGFEAVNDSVFRIHLKQPQYNFLSQLTLAFCKVVPAEAVDKYGRDFRKHPVGTGPFKLRFWREEVKLVMVKNEKYHEVDEAGKRLPYVDAVVVSFMTDRNVEISQFRKGQLEFISGIPPAVRESMITTEGELKPSYKNEYYLIRQPWLKTDYLGILVDEEQPVSKNSLLINKQVRLAINYAIDRVKLVRYLRNGIGKPALNGFTPPGTPGFSSFKISGFSYDPDKARELLFEAGVSEDKPKKITLLATNEYKDVCEYIQRDLKDIGISVEIMLVPAIVQKQMVANVNSEFFRKSWTGDYPDALNFLQLFYSRNFSPDGPNYTHFRSVYFDNLYEEALQTIDDQKRFELCKKMEEAIRDEAPVVPLFYDESTKLVQKYVTGLESNAMNMLDLKRVKINKQKKAFNEK
ncbi:MAG: ABC transporter substrate-binding protein [Flavobacteriales bacterium]